MARKLREADVDWPPRASASAIGAGREAQALGLSKFCSGSVRRRSNRIIASLLLSLSLAGSEAVEAGEPGLIFADDFESGDASAWSAVVPPLSDRCALLPDEPVGGCPTGDECYWIGNTSTCGTPYCQFDPDTGIDYMCNHGERCDDGASGYFLNVCFKGKSCVPWNDPIGPLCSKLCRVSLDILNRTDLDFPTVDNRNGDPSYPCWRDDDGFTGLEDNPLPAADCVPFVHSTSALYSLSAEAGIPDGYDLPLDLGVCLDYATFGEFYVPQEPRVAPKVTLTQQMIEALLGRLGSTPWSATPK